jgi:serine/threonine-protein kinase
MAEARAGRTGRTLRLAKYDVLEEIGHGGMATVYRAHDPRLGRDVALKVIHPHLRDSPQVAQRFFAEAKAVAKLRHANIVEVFDVSAQGEEEQYLVVELVRGHTLRKLLQKHGALPPEVAATIALELLSALAHAHAAGVVHRDIKPENVMIEHATKASPGDSGRVAVKLMDFGIAKLLDAQGVTSTGQVLGSPAHMAPEQIEGGDVDARADVFGLGVLLYECIVGHLPFEGNNPAQVLRRVLDGIYAPAEHERATVGKAWSAIVDRALAHDPAARFEDATAMRDTIQKELARLAIDKPREELEAFFDDADAYAKSHERRMIDVLCANAASARKRRDALAAAADYNRALAYAPNDPQLLKIIATMNRAEARARFLRSGGRAVAVMLALGVVAFFVTRAIKPKIVPDPAPLKPTAVVLASSAPTASESAAPSATASASATAVPTAHSSQLPMPIRIPASASAKPVEVKRDLVVTVSPVNGVLVAVDGAEFNSVSGSTTFTVDGKTHVVSFKCTEDLCIEQQRVVPAGDERATVDVAMAIKPATLIVQGDANATYTILQKPTLAVSANMPVRVAMKSKRETVTVKQLPSEKTATAQLEAGKTVTVTISD